MATVADELPISGSGLGGAARAAEMALKLAVRLWFLVLVTGQLLFVVHIVSFYGRAAAAGDFARWNKALSPGYVPGDSAGNAALGLHLMVAALITLLGLLQLTPQIRNRFPVFHRWSGRIYVGAAFLASGSALYLQLLRPGNLAGTVEQHIGIEINAVLIMLCAAMALWHALARQFDTHRRWALRLFLVVSGVWFFRAGLFFWIVINHGPVGFDPDAFRGPALTVLSFAQYLLPLAVLELYLRTRDRPGTARRSAMAKFVMATVIALLTVAMGVGIVGATGFLVASGVAI
jgi:hypothetical protein